MRPTKPGFYWYRDEPVKVWKHYRGSQLRFTSFGISLSPWVISTDASDWGPEIKMGEDVDND